MTGRAFLDTNVIVYLVDVRTPAKQRAAARLLQTLAVEQVVPVVSTQVLQEAYSALTRKLGIDPAAVLTALQMMVRGSFVVEKVDVPLIWRAASGSMEHRISFWDALIVESARAAHCSVLYTEDLQHGRDFAGTIIHNPFAA